ncbi:SMC-Scp complex subunit ScpB [Kozakia baliensis]|uniref:SMC-Scp complex subunit ScpB n=1 Tax=Kozakia baliensis TaxID=153496 RepID=UPI00068BD8C5|nr:SMC-Scp complex subunit ScpB [Kozakia baliensis]
MIEPSQLIEAMIFASAEPVKEDAMRTLLAEQGREGNDIRALLDEIQARYADHGVELVEVGKGWQFRTRTALAPALTTTIEKPRRLSRSAMETLAVIAYHQPCTRADIEGIRGVALSQSVLDALLEDALIVPKGRKEMPGRPVLWGTSSTFLTSFGLPDLNALPRREELLLDPATVGHETGVVSQSASS